MLKYNTLLAIRGAKTSSYLGNAGLIWHGHNWRVENVCYLQDLYVDPDVRGSGVGRALIEAVYAEADRRGTPAVYWLTQDFNQPARRLYDRQHGLETNLFLAPGEGDKIENVFAGSEEGAAL